MRRLPETLLNAVWLRNIGRVRLDGRNSGDGESVRGAVVVVGRHGTRDSLGRPRRGTSARNAVREEVGGTSRQLREAEAFVNPWRTAADGGNQIVEGADVPQTELGAVSLFEVGWVR